MLRRTGLILLFLVNILTVTGNNSRAEAAKILTIGNYTLLSSTRVSLYEFDYVYKASITNTGPAVTGVTASAASTSAYIKILQGNLTFGNVPANATVTSSDTFTVRHDRRGAFDTASLAWSIKSAPSQVTVPNVVGMTRSNAQAAILAAKLKVGTVTEEASSEIPAGNIISQTPVAGTSVAAGSAVNLVVSAGSTSVTVPNLVGQTQASAQAAIIAAKLVVGAITQAPSKTVPAGSVISQNPGAGATATQGSAVDLVVSSGKPALAVPDVTGLILAAAKAAITRAGLNVGTVTRQNSAAVISGNVISQEPAAGTSTSAGATVKLVVSSGPAPANIIVPDVVGQTQAAGRSAISAAHLSVGAISQDYSAGTPKGNIIAQSPGAGTNVAVATPVALVVSLGPISTPPLPPDPASVAPPVDPTVATSIASATAFLYSGSNPIQTGVPVGSIDKKRAAVLRGRVFDRNKAPLAGVNITVKGHPEFGQTFSRADGMFDMAVNGGGLLTVNYVKSGYLPAQRQVNVPWQDYNWLPEVVLSPVDAKVTTINLASASQVQAHQGDTVTDKDGTRQATLLFSPGNTARMVMPDGSTQSLGSLSVRTTEYTVGAEGPKAMPGLLPPSSGYTYAVELSADEAVTAGAKQVTFSQPVYFYVDDFIGFPVGSPVPTGYYDRDAGQWKASQNGRVIKILSVTGGVAAIDTDGDGQADDAAKLAALGITRAEQEKLAALYPQAPKQLWRVPITHFSPWDCNWPYGPPKDATAPNLPEPNDNTVCKSCEEQGSIIECQNQVLGESIGVPGTSFTLNYRTGNVPGYKTAYTLNIPLSGSSVPASLKRIDLIVQVAGRQFSQSFPAAPNQSHAFTWDGKDAYGNSPHGKQPVTIQIGYVYDGVYMQPSQQEGAFGRFTDSGNPITSDQKRNEITLWQTVHTSIGILDNRSQVLGGWDLNIHQMYDPAGQALLSGGGNRRSTDNMSATIITVAGNGNGGYDGDGGPATSAALGAFGVAVGSGGSIYIVDKFGCRIRRVGSDGVITTFAGNGNDGFGGDGGPATQASLSEPEAVAAGPDGSIYIVDSENNRIRRVGPDGIISTIAGNGNFEYGGDGGPAIQASLFYPVAVAAGPDGSIYIAEAKSYRIRRVGPDGIITTVAGNGSFDYGGDGGPATQASLSEPDGVAVGFDGSIYIADMGARRVRRVGLDGIITTFAGNGVTDYSGDGGPATQASFFGPNAVAVSPDGSIYIADMYNYRVRRVGTDGIITSVAGNGNQGYSGDGGAATRASLGLPDAVAVGPDGNVYIADIANNRIRRVGPALPGVSLDTFYVPSEDGSELYIFNGSGKHLRTLNTLTGAALFSFGYDSGGRLISVTDGDGNVTTIERDSSGNPTAIVAPFGQRTKLAVDADGYLASVTNPAGEATRMAYDAGGLMNTFTDPKGNVHKFAYDEDGLLVRDDDPAGGYKTLAGTRSPSASHVVINTALGRTADFMTEFLGTGDIRQTITTAAGGKNMSLEKTDGSEQINLADGTTGKVTKGPDPRFGMQSPISGSVIKTPSGLTYSASMTRNVTLANPSNVLSMTGFTDKITVNGHLYSVAYDAAKNMFTFTSPAGRASSGTIDLLGRPLSFTPAPGLTPLSITYNSYGKLQQFARGSLRLAYGYDVQGRVASRTDAMGNTAQYGYDSADRVNRLTLPSGRRYQFTYDANGNPASITMPSGAVHNLGYTSIDQGSDYTPPGNSPYGWQYSLDREWTKTILPGGRNVDASYDSGGRLTDILYPEASVSFQYNDKTERISNIVRSPAGGGATQQLAYIYDGNLVTGRTFTGAANGQFSYTYDNNFLLKQINLASGSNSVATPITRDADGFVTGYGPFTFTRGGPGGSVTGISDAVSDVAVIYDNLGRLSTHTHTVNGRKIYSIQLSYDSRGNISQKVESVAGAPAVTWKYKYDADGQLVQTLKNGVNQEQYEYDVNGNRTSYRRPDWTGALLSEFDVQDRIVRQGGVTYQFNSDGQLTQRGSDTFQYSALGELLKATVAGKAVTYTYDGMGRLAARTDSAGTWQYMYGSLQNPFQLTAARDTAGTLTTFFYDDAGRLFAMDKGGTKYYVGTDQVGTPKVVSDASGNIVKTMEFDSFGMWTLDSKPDFDLPVGYGGGLNDKDTQLVRFGFRDYEPAAGRWTAKDPIFFRGGQGNLFGYVLNNPVNLLDPFGLWELGIDAFPGLGFGISFGSSNGRGWIKIRAGFGVGTALSLNEFNGPPDNAQGLSTGVGVCGKVGVRFGVLSIPFGVREGVYRDWNDPENLKDYDQPAVLPTFPSLRTGPNPSDLLDPKPNSSNGLGAYANISTEGHVAWHW